MPYRADPIRAETFVRSATITIIKNKCTKKKHSVYHRVTEVNIPTSLANSSGIGGRGRLDGLARLLLRVAGGKRSGKRTKCNWRNDDDVWIRAVKCGGSRVFAVAAGVRCARSSERIRGADRAPRPTKFCREKVVITIRSQTLVLAPPLFLHSTSAR